MVNVVADIYVIEYSETPLIQTTSGLDKMVGLEGIPV